MDTGISLFGGFHGNESQISERSAPVEGTVITADLPYYNTIEAAEDVSVDGFEVKAYLANSANLLYAGGASISLANCSFSGSREVAISIVSATLAMSNCRVSDNWSDKGDVVVTGALKAENCNFSNNNTRYSAGQFDLPSVRILDGSLVMTDCLFNENGSGALEITNSTSITVDRTLFLENVSNHIGGAVTTWDSSVSFRNCLFNLNIGSGNAFQLNNTNTSLVNCTLANLYGYFYEIRSGTSELTIANSIIWNRSSRPIQSTAPEKVSVTYSALPGWPGPGNIDLYPGFNESRYDFHLTADSPCIDSGSNTAVAAREADLDGNARIWDGDDVPGAMVDMGAYEFGAGPLWADVNEDHAISYLDLFTFAGWWHDTANQSNNLGDIRPDGVINEADLLMIRKVLLNETPYDQ